MRKDCQALFSSTKVSKRSDKHVESESELKKKLTALVYQLQHENPYSAIPGRNYSNMYVSADKLHESSGTANTWTAKKFARIRLVETENKKCNTLFSKKLRLQ